MFARLALATMMASLVLLFGMPQSALACHKDTPHGAQTTCDGGGTPTSRLVFVTSDTYDGGLNIDPNSCGTGVVGADCICQYEVVLHRWTVWQRS